MNDENVGGIHWSFWVVGVVALIWNGMGAMNYLMQMSAESLASYPESHRVIIDARPTWATGAFAIAVFGGVLGSLLLLLKKSVAFYIFVVSLLGVIVTMIHTMGVDISVFSGFEIAMMIVSPLVVATFLVCYVKHTQNRGWVH